MLITLDLERQTTKLQNLPKGRYPMYPKSRYYSFLKKPLRNLSRYHEANPNLGISGPQMIDGTGQFLLESKRGLAFDKGGGVIQVFRAFQVVCSQFVWAVLQP